VLAEFDAPWWKNDALLKFPCFFLTPNSCYDQPRLHDRACFRFVAHGIGPVSGTAERLGGPAPCSFPNFLVFTPPPWQDLAPYMAPRPPLIFYTTPVWIRPKEESPPTTVRRLFFLMPLDVFSANPYFLSPGHTVYVPWSPLWSPVSSQTSPLYLDPCGSFNNAVFFCSLSPTLLFSDVPRLPPMLIKDHRDEQSFSFFLR